MKKTEDEIKDIILAWAIRRHIMIGYKSINDLAKEIIQSPADTREMP